MPNRIMVMSPFDIGPRRCIGNRQPQPPHERDAALAEPRATLPATANPLVFVAMTPCRIVDTRTDQGFSGGFGPPSLIGGASRTFPIQSSATRPIPMVAQAYSFNVTVVPLGPLGYVTAYPTGGSVPLAATLTDVQGAIVSNAAIVAAGSNGSIDVFASSATDIVIDINGYYAGSTDLATGNVALGASALSSDTIGGGNTAVGGQALTNNTTGGANTALGLGTLLSNSTGVNNTATGQFALQHNTTGSSNTALGAGALAFNTTGTNSTAIGLFALASAIGANNIAIGAMAGANLNGNNSNNIHIGNAGSSNDNGVVRIGTPGTQTSFFAAGIRGVTTGNNDAVPVVIDSNGQLGTVISSRMFKENIQDMGDASADLMKLRPVTFRYQKPFANGSKPIQYGLIAEEVSEVYPDLVAHSADGRVETVKYQVLDSMLLNEVQRLNKENQALQERLSKLEAALAVISARQ